LQFGSRGETTQFSGLDPSAKLPAIRRGGSAIQSLSTIEIAYCCVVIVLAYAARGSTGFGAAAAFPLMGLVVPIKLLIPAWTLLGICAGITLLGRDSRNIAWKEAAKILPACVLGVLLGIYLFSILDGLWLQRGLGILVVCYGCYSLWATFRPIAKPHGPSWLLAAVMGFGGGVVGATFGTLASLFFAIYFDATRLPKEAFRATMSAVLLVLTVGRGIGYWTVDQYSGEVLFIFAFAVPMMLLGIFIGDRIHTSLSDRAFRRTICAILIVSGTALLVK
jgi:uncharacterized protein